jgi:hypothetical protein
LRVGYPSLHGAAHCPCMGMPVSRLRNDQNSASAPAVHAFKGARKRETSASMVFDNSMRRCA